MELKFIARLLHIRDRCVGGTPSQAIGPCDLGRATMYLFSCAAGSQ